MEVIPEDIVKDARQAKREVPEVTVFGPSEIGKFPGKN
jgi:hypothetical protein